MRITKTKWRQNDAKSAAIMVLSYYYLTPVRKVLLQAHREGCAVWLSSYVYVFVIWTCSTMVNQRLKIFFSKN